MPIAVYVDAEDRLTTVHRINALADRDGGTVVAHVPPTRFRAQLPQDLLIGLGCNRQASDWPRGSKAAWTLARAWCHGFRIRRLIVYGAWRLHRADLEHLVSLSDEDDIDVCLVMLAGARTLTKVPLDGYPSRRVERLFTRRQRIRKPYTEELSLLPPLPAAPFPRFLAECAGVLESNDQGWRLHTSYAEALNTAKARIRIETPTESVVDHLVEQFRTSLTPNEVLIRLRATQAAALWEGLLVEVELVALSRAVAGLLDTAASNHRQWPLPETVKPVDQATAAVAWATALPTDLLVGVKTSDLNGDCSEIDGNIYSRIPRWLRAPIRAQKWLKEQQLDGPSPLLSATAKTPTPGGLHNRLLRIGQPAANAPSSDLQMREALESILRITDVRSPPEQAEPADHWVPAYSTGRLGQELDYEEFPDTWRREIVRLAQLNARRYLRGSRYPWGRQRPWREQTLDDDAEDLYAVLIRTGGHVDRLSIHAATNWTADRLAAASRELNDRLETVGSAVVERPDGVMELRVYDDPVVRDFIATIANRTVVNEGFSPLAGHLMYRLLETPKKSLNLAALGDPNHEREIQRLVAMGIVRFDGESMKITDEAHGGLATGNWRAADRVHCR
jgi:hypothetical protein